MAIMSNEDIHQVGVYAGVAGAAGAVGLAYGYDAHHPNFKAQARETRARIKKEKAANSIADEVVTNTESKKQRKQRERVQARLERGTRAEYAEVLDDTASSGPLSPMKRKAATDTYKKTMKNIVKAL